MNWKSATGLVLAGTIAAAPAWLLALPLHPHPVAAAAAATSATAVKDQLIKNSESPITSGAVLRSYTWKSTRSNKPISVNARAIVVDLSNPNVKLDVMTGSGGKFTKKQTVAGMARETGAVAGINGDFYNTQSDGAPQGPQISSGVVMSSAPFLDGYYAFALTKDRKPVIDKFSFSGVLKAADGTTFNLNGINKAVYWIGKPGVHAMNDSMFIYTSAWGSNVRAVDRKTDLLEVLVTDGIVQQIQPGSLKMTPPENGYIIRTEGKARAYVLEHLKVGDAVSYEYQLKGTNAGLNTNSDNLDVLIGGGTMLVDQGRPVENLSLPDGADAKSPRSRTTIGYSKDGRFVYLVTADKVDGESDGVTLKELGRLLSQMGIWRALNMDGGGSSQMVSRPLGDQTAVIVNGLENSWQRPVVNGLGVYSTAPQGVLSQLILSGPAFMLKGESADFTLKGVDQYFNPVNGVDPAGATWKSSDPKGAIEAGTFVPAAIGSTKVTAAIGSVSQSMDVKVIGRDDIQEMTVVPSSSIAMENGSVKLSVKIKTKSGAVRMVSGDLFNWELYGVEGTVDGNLLKIDSIKDSKYARVVARYDGYGSSAVLPAGTIKTLIDWDSQATDVPTTFTSTDGVTGEVKTVSADDTGQNRAVELNYDMTHGTTDTKAAYLTFPNGFTVSGSPQKIQMRVRGDQSLNWLRAEMIDASGKLYYIDLEKTVNWKDWKTVSADLSGLNMHYPVKLNRIYLASTKVGEDERNPIGSVAFDQISFLYKQEIPALPKNTAVLTVGKKKITVNGKAMTMDVAPQIIGDWTYVPVRFVIDALGGELKWDPKENRVTVFRGAQMIEMIVGKKDIFVNGLRVTSETAPVIKNSRTLIPLRLLSEQFGWKVEWNNKTKEVTLH